MISLVILIGCCPNNNRGARIRLYTSNSRALSLIKRNVAGVIFRNQLGCESTGNLEIKIFVDRAFIFLHLPGEGL